VFLLSFLHLILSPPDSSLLYIGRYDLVLVSFSVALAIFASYASLQVSQQVAAARSSASRRLWVAAGGLSLGLGIWGMHFIGMLAFSLPCSSSYDASITFLSMVPGIVASMLAISIISRRELSRAKLAEGGLLIGAGIGAMHYSGMAAMRLDGLIRYDAGLFLLSILVAIALGTFAVWIKFRLQEWQSRWSKWAMSASAVVMGLAVSGMHYTAMAATYFIRDGGSPLVTAGIPPAFLSTVVLAATSLIVVTTIVATYIGNRNLASIRRFSKLIGALVAGWLVLAWLSADYYYKDRGKDFYQQELQAGQQHVEQIADNIDGEVQRLKGISLMVSRDKDTQKALIRFGPDTAPSALPYGERKQRWTEDRMFAELNSALLITATHLKADDVFILTAAGDCIAASNALKAGSFVGTNYVDRDYFRQARAGQPGHQYAMGRVSKIPGLFYSAPVLDKGLFLGVVVVKRDLTNFSRWTNPVKAFIADSNGVIVLTPDKQLEFRLLPEAPAARLSPETRLLQYKQATFRPLEISAWRQERYPSAVRIDGSEVPAILVSKLLPEDAITVYVPRPLGELVRFDVERNWLFALLAAAGSLLIVAASGVIHYLGESKETAENLRIAATAFESQEGMIITDTDGVILRVNKAFTEITGHAAAELIGRTPRLLKSGRHPAAFYAAIWDSIERTGAWQGEIWNR
jgi:NO-binding membrane sensor protein with MHYT domain/PAS domain-containing protein